MRTEPALEAHADTAWWRHPLVREIALVLVVKLALIFGLWWAFFDLPEDRRIGGAEVGAHVAGLPSPAIRNTEETLP